jgi:hypothetical protein
MGMHKELEFTRKTTNWKRFSAFEGSRSSTKRHKALTHDPSKKSRENALKSTNENHPKIAPKMTWKSQRVRRERSSQCQILPYIQRLDSLQMHGKSSLWGKGIRKQSRRMSFHPPPRAIYMKSSSGGKWPHYPYNLKGRYTPLRGNLDK